jgi:hypothetical protein
MGFEPAKVEAALASAGADFNKALDLLSSGDIAASAPAAAGVVAPEAEKPRKSLPKTNSKNGSGDHFREQTPSDAPEAAMIDQRIAQLVEMGFDGKEAEQALKLAGHDFNGAVTLLSEEKGARGYSDDSPLM